ncbi:hypothetical protein CRG98_045337 [Punica granatum]|uniref:Uncharacterized protein n=1 Tax=Punica granatum TaxID=22663 RepID=A0A2I0HSP1_PUNGR|nr:hypothetical protein CRG98_045337 [Punica granatum]
MTNTPRSFSLLAVDLSPSVSKALGSITASDAYIYPSPASLFIVFVCASLFTPLSKVPFARDPVISLVLRAASASGSDRSHDDLSIEYGFGRSSASFRRGYGADYPPCGLEAEIVKFMCGLSLLRRCAGCRQDGGSTAYQLLTLVVHHLGHLP